MLAESGMTRCTLTSSPLPLVGASHTADQLYLLFPKRIQVFGPAPDHSYNGEMLLNDPITCHSLYGNVMLLLYDNKALEMRLLDDWKNPVMVGDQVEALSVQAYGQTTIVLRRVEGLTVMRVHKESKVAELLGRIELEPYAMKGYDFGFQGEEGRLRGVGCVLLRDNTIRKYTLKHPQGFICDSEIQTSNKLLVDIFVVRMKSEQERNFTEFIVTVDGTLRLDFYDLLDDKPLLTYWPEGKPAEVAVLKILFDHSNNQLWVQRGTAGVLCIKLRQQVSNSTPNNESKFVEGCKHYELGEEMLALAGANGLIVKRQETISLVNFAQVKTEKPENNVGHPLPKSIEEVKKEKEEIRQQILSYSRKCFPVQENFAIQTESQKGIDQSTQILQPTFNSQGMATQPPNTNHISTGPIQIPQISTSTQQTNTDFRHASSKQTNTDQLQSNSQGTITDSRPSSQKETNTDGKKVENRETAMEQRTLASVSISTDYRKSQSIGIQTEKEAAVKKVIQVKVTEQQMEKLHSRLAKKLEQVEKKLLTDVQGRYSKVEAQLTRACSTISQTLQNKSCKLISKQLQQLLTSNFLPKLQKYFSLTFDKVTETFQKSLKYYQQQNDKSSVKMTQMTREVIEKSKAVVEKAVTIFKESALKFGERTVQITKEWEGRAEEIKKIGEMGENIQKSIHQKTSATEERTGKIEEMIGRILEEIKLQEEVPSQQPKLQNQVAQQQILQPQLPQQPALQQFGQSAQWTPPPPPQQYPMGWFPPPPSPSPYYPYPQPQYSSPYAQSYPYSPYPQPPYPQPQSYPQPQPQPQQQPQLPPQPSPPPQHTAAMLKLMQQLVNRRRKKSNDNTQ